MIIDEEQAVAQPCVHHPRRSTLLRCGKCEAYICTACSVQTPVGVRCRTCANLRRLPQFDVGLGLLGRSAAAGVVVSAVAWFLVGFVPYLSFFLAILVGIAVGEVMSRLAKRRVSRALEAAAVLDVFLGMLAVQGMSALTSGVRYAPFLLVPGIIAAFVAVVKLR
jgi:hypothetical protein